MAESIVRASTMGAIEGIDEGTIMANLCPNTGADDAQTQPPSEAIASLATNTPCKWRPVPVEDLAAMTYMAPERQIRIGATLYDLREAPWAIRTHAR